MQSSMAMAKSEEAQHHVRIIKIKIKGPTRPADADDHNNIKKMKNEQQPNHFMCDICNKCFASVHALNGHARVHSHKVSKDTTPVVAKTNNKNNVKTCCESENSSRVATPYDDGTSLLRWSVSRKRSPRSGANSCSEFSGRVDVDPLMLEAANTLLLLANGNLGEEVKLSDDQFHSPKRSKSKTSHGSAFGII